MAWKSFGLWVKKACLSWVKNGIKKVFEVLQRKEEDTLVPETQKVQYLSVLKF